MCNNNINFISKKYESGNAGYDAVSNLTGDPGGVSYGAFQLSSAAGTLQKFLKASKYYLKFKGMAPGSATFNAQWKLMCADKLFCDAQDNFIKITHFDPVSKYWDKIGLAHSCAIDSALFSMSVQHSYAGCMKILDAAEAAIGTDYTDDDAIKALYAARSKYVSGLSLPDNIEKSLLNRYIAEEALVHNIQD